MLYQLSYSRDIGEISTTFVALWKARGRKPGGP